MKRIIGLLALLLLLCPPTMARKFYAGPGGSWSNDGLTHETRWPHPNRFNYSPAVPGDTLVLDAAEYDTCDIPLKQGDITHKTAWIPSNGIAGRGTVILHSGPPVANNWTNSSGQIYYTPLTSSVAEWTASNAARFCTYERITGTVDSLLLPMSTLGNLTAAGQCFYDDSANRLYVWCRGGGNPGTKIRYTTKPLITSNNEADDYNYFIGLDLRGGYQAVAVLGHGGSDYQNSGGGGDFNCFLHCNIGLAIETQSNNPAVIYHGNTYGSTKSTWSQFNNVIACSLTQCRSLNGGTGLHGGFGLELYACDRWVIDSCEILRNGGGGIALKMGNYPDYGLSADSIKIRFNRLDGKNLESTTGIWVGNKVKALDIIGNYILNMNNSISFLTSASGDPMEGGFRVWNNTIVNADESLVQFAPHNINGANSFQYNYLFDSTGAPANGHMVFRPSGDGTGLTETPSSEQYWNSTTGGVINNNRYWTGGASFSCLFMSTSGYTGTNWTSWTAHFDANSSNTINPVFDASHLGNYARSSSSAEIDVTHSGRTWTRYGAWQPGGAITDSCIEITGKIALPLPDTCYCVVDSLLATFANRDTLIHTNGMDNIRIWGYHSGGGRGIIAYSASDAGSNAWVTDSAKGSVVLHISGSENVLVKNLAIVPRVVGDSVRGLVVVNALTTVTPIIDNDSLIAAGFSSRAYQQSNYGGGETINQLLQNSYFGTISKGYHRRDQLYGATIRLESGTKSNPAYQYAFKIRNCRIQTIHTGIGTAGIPGGTIYPTFFIDSNTIVVDARNDLFMTYDDNDVNNSAGDPYCINVDGADGNSRIIGNVMTAGTAYYGGDGMLLQHINATISDPFEVAYNTMPSMNHGDHPRIAPGRQALVFTYGRNYDANLSIKGLWYHHNSGYGVVDEDGGTNFAGSYGECVRIGFENGANGNRVENNHFEIVPRDSVTRTGAGSLEVSGLTFEQHDSTNSAGDAGTGNNIARYNYWRVPRNPIWLGGTRIGIGADNVQIIGDTCNTIYDGDSTFARFHQSGTYYSHSINNTLQDMVLQGYANASDVIKGTISELPDSLGKQLSYLRSLTVNLKDVTGSNANGGTIWAINAYGNRINFPNTNVFGNSSDTLRFRFFGYDALPGDGYAVQDSNGYNNFTFWGKLGNDSISASAAINWTSSQTINLQLTGVPPDSIAYVVNSDTVYANLTFDRQWIDFFRDKMGYKVKVMTDDAAAAITDVEAYHGYFLSATISGANLANLRTTTKGVIICDQLLYDDYLVATGQTAVTFLTNSWTLDRLDATHAITNRMFDKIKFEYTSNVASYGYTGLPSGAKVLYCPSNKKWDGVWGDANDTSFCYAIETGDALTTGVATGRRVVALSHYSQLTQLADAGWCHPFELMGNIASWAFGDEQNAYAAEYNCYSNDIATSPGPEVEQAWDEFGGLLTTGREVYPGARFGFDEGYLGLGFLNFRYWDWKVAPSFIPDSLIWTYKINYRGYGTDNPPALPSDTITLATIISATRLTFDTTTLNHISMYDLHFSTTGKGVLVRSEIGADTTQQGDTITFAGGSRNGSNDTLYYTRCGSPISGATSCSGFFNGTAGSQVRLIMSDSYGGFDFWVKIYRILPQTVWDLPRASASQGGNPEGSSTRTWANRNFIKSGNTDSVRWSAPNLVAGVDYSEAAIDSFRMNKDTFKPDGTSEIRFKLPGNVFTNPEYNGFVWKTFDLTGLSGTDSSDIEIVPPSVVTVNGLIVQKFEMYLSPQSQPQAVNKKRKLILE